LEIGLTEKQVYKYLEKEKKDLETVKALIRDTKEGHKSGKINNPAAYLVTLLERNAKPKATVKKDKKVESAKNGESQEARKREEAIILQLKEKFEVFRSKLANEKIAQLSDEEWKAFEEYAKNNKMFTSSFMERGKINRAKAKSSMLMSAFIGLKLKDYDTHFKEWAFSNFGYQIADINGNLRILVEQKSMFG